MAEHSRLLQTVLDATRPGEPAEFYRRLLGLTYRPGDEPPAAGVPDEPDWLVLRDPEGADRQAFQYVDRLPRTTWPDPEVPMQLHLDLTVPDTAGLTRQRERAEALGAGLLLDRYDDPDEPLYVFADPSGHPFCVLVSSAHRASGGRTRRPAVEAAASAEATAARGPLLQSRQTGGDGVGEAARSRPRSARSWSVQSLTLALKRTSIASMTGAHRTSPPSVEEGPDHA
ncbi:hypothetical protein GCM10010358_43150 [Streptomyces minutiscleroticus]|uniref:VOC domain-containing protein n=1 Tax=Streptomyces minutiscleroticus TaxID=68238 RepID=A0A918U374_9ACTN|nr:VOC family protein [Streptomyces minutiscleroticus]GGX84325.1 hypothetical protein GCM10010358_43150 [Streptomyces minutiscleroticus]